MQNNKNTQRNQIEQLEKEIEKLKNQNENQLLASKNDDSNKLNKEQLLTI